MNVRALPDVLDSIRNTYNEWVTPMNNIKFQTFRPKSVKADKMIKWLEQVEATSVKMRKLLEELNANT